MRASRALILLRLPLLVATAASAALLVEYQNAGDPAFCSANSGCMKVRMSPYSKLFGVPLPIIGLAAYAILYAASLAARTRTHHRLIAAITALGGVSGAVLIMLQAVFVEAFCKWCLAVDVSSIVAAVFAALLYVRASRDPATERTVAVLGKDSTLTLAWTIAGVLSISLPFFWARYPVVPPLPPELAALQVPGKVNVLSFTDFQCPFCRKFHPKLDQVREELGDRAHFVRLMMPLPGHPGAMPAAKAWACVPDPLQDAMAHELYTASTPTLLRGGDDLAVKLGVERDRFLSCIADQRTQAKIDRDVELFKTIEGGGLPLTYVNDRVVVGLNPDRLAFAISVAREPKRPALPVPLMWIALALSFVAASVLTLKKNDPPAGAPVPGGEQV